MYKSILVAIDGGAASRRALTEALYLAEKTGASLKLAYIVGLFLTTPLPIAGSTFSASSESLHERGRRILARAVSQATRRGISAKSTILENSSESAAEVIVQHAKKWRASLIVMGTHGRSGLSRLALGSDAEKVVRTSPIPVLVVRAKAKK